MSKLGGVGRVVALVLLATVGLVCTGNPDMKVVSTLPVDGATGVDLEPTIRVTFSDEIYYGLDPEPYVVLTRGTTDVDCDVTASTIELSIVPVDPLEPDTVYVVTVLRGLPSEEDETLQQDNSFRFRTQAPDGPNLEVVSTDPTNTATGVPLSARILVTFDETLDFSTVDATSCFLEDAAGTPVTCELDEGVVVDADQIEIRPTADLAEGEAYTVTLTTAIQDVNGDALASDYAFSFTTIAEETELPSVCVGPTRLDVEAGPDVLPALDGDGAGMTVIAWLQNELSATSPAFIRQIFVVQIDPDGTLGTPAELVDDVRDYGAPAVAMNEDGHGIVAGPYRPLLTAEHGIYAMHYDPVSGWASTVAGPVPTHAAQVSDVDVAMDVAGNATAVYLVPSSGAGSPQYVEYATYASATTTWSAGVSFQKTADLGPPRVAMSASGATLLVTYDDEDGGGLRTLTLPADEEVFDAVGWTASQPEVAVDASGDGFVVWRATSVDDGRIRALPVSACAPDGVPVFIDGGEPGLCSEPAIAVDDDGSAVAVWALHDPATGYSIRVNQYTPASGWGNPETLAEVETMLSKPQVSIGDEGLIAVTWQGNQHVYVTYAIGSSGYVDPIIVSELTNPLSVYFATNPVIHAGATGYVATAFEINDAGLADVYTTICD